MVESVPILECRVFLPHCGYWFQQERPHDVIDFLPHDSDLQAMQISYHSQ